MMIYGWREREEVLRFFEMVTGLRMNHNYIRPGGVAADLPDGWRDDVLRLLDMLPDAARRVRHAHDRPADLARAAAGRRRHHRRGGLALGATGPILRSTGYAVGPPPRHARTSPTTRSTSTSSSAPTATASTATPSASTRSASRSRIVRQILDACRKGDYRIQDKKVTPPPRARIDESMEALIHHFKIFTEGFKVPEGEVYVAVESPRGELGCYLVSRRHRRSPTACTSGARAS